MKKVTADEVLAWQQEQYSHDRRNHGDILNLHKTDRLKHYGLHFAKYVGRLARGTAETKSHAQTICDAFLVCLSAANTLHQHLQPGQPPQTNDAFLRFADAAGRFADACEKIDHLEDFVSLARNSNQDIFEWIIESAVKEEMDLSEALVKARRLELKSRMFYNVEP